MKIRNNLLLIGGTKQNVGKTTLTCDIIKKYSPGNNIIAIKTSCHFHGILDTDVVIANNEKFVIVKETVTDTGKDSARMLKNGAYEVYFIQAKDENIGEAYIFLDKFMDKNSLVICESASLRTYVKPSIFIGMKSDKSDTIPENKNNLHLADLFIFNYLSVKEDINSIIQIKQKKWIRK
ncbi:MAG: hypothetical protein ABFR62_08915 [Bacteroidota bacterium]